MPSHRANPPITVLIVDDDAIFSRSMARILAGAGYDCREAASGAAAREALENGDVAAVLCDLRLPGESGLDLLASLAADDDVLAALRRLGVRIALDDFGTGYSSLNHLHQFPVDVLKIDRSFIAHLGSDVEATAIVTSVVHLAQALGLEVVAEGIETAEQLGQLRLLGCQLAQGYFWSRPVPADQLDSWLEPRGGDTSECDTPASGYLKGSRPGGIQRFLGHGRCPTRQVGSDSKGGNVKVLNDGHTTDVYESSPVRRPEVSVSAAERATGGWLVGGAVPQR
jgi:CheY-like chemotaxis protein